MSDRTVFQCACRFTRKDEFSPAQLIESCGFHASVQKDLERALGDLATLEEMMKIMCPAEGKPA